jgi:putative copper export protein/mono/diheme cytochrome c family protein/peroxiredoxin
MTELAALVRFAHVASLVLLAGSFVFLIFVARPFVAGRFVAHPADRESEPGVFHAYCLAWHGRIARWSLVVAVLTALAGLWLQAVTIGGSGAALAAGTASTASVVLPMLSATLYGNVWLARMALAAMLAVLLFRGRRGQGHGEEGAIAGLALSACLLGSMALAGHAAAGEGAEFIVHSTADVLHLLAAGAWLGALPPLVLLLARCAGARGDPTGMLTVKQITRRFSALGMICVATLIVTGSINAWVLVGGVPQLLGTAYGQLLLLKLSLLLPMIGVAAVNLLKINPAIAAAANDAGVMPGLAWKLSRNALIEAGLGFAILAIVGYLGMTPPARHDKVDWPFAFRWDWALLDSAPKARAESEMGFAWLVLGLFVMQFAFLSRRFRFWTAAAGAALVVYAANVVLTPVITDAYPTTYLRPSVAYHTISVANGGKRYAADCAICHGVNGYGDGPAAEGLRPRPADLAGRHANAHTVGDLFWWISMGIPNTAMQGYAARLAEEDRWDLINYVRALAGAKRARGLAPVIEDRAWLVAPDFVYASSDGQTRTLKDHRGSKLVLLVLTAPRSEARLALLAEAVSRLSSQGVELIVVPPESGRADLRSAAPPLVTEGNREIHATYGLFASSFADEAPPDGARHVEYLIDRRGYIRARWLPGENDAWRDPAAIARQAELLLKEAPGLPAPEDHVH